MANLTISQLRALTGTDVTVNDLLPIVDNSASETKNIQIDQLALAIGPLFPDGSIPGSKINGELAAGSVGTEELADDSVTGLKLADNSSGIVGTRPAVGDHIGQICIDDEVAFVWNGAEWSGFEGANSIITIAYNSGPVELGFTKTGNDVSVDTKHADSTEARQFLAGPTASAGSVVMRQIIGADLPVASDSEQGAVQVNGNGLTMTGNTLGLSNTIEPSNGAFYVVDYGPHGEVLEGRAITPADLPVATGATNGISRPGLGLTVDSTGALNHTSATPGEFTKVTINDSGHVQVGGSLATEDLPDIDAGSITQGTLPPERIGKNSIQGQKFADYSTCYIQPNQPVNADFLGQFWLNPETSQLYAFARGSGDDYFIPVGFGRLAQENLRFCGTFDAENSTITSLTEYGIQAGLTLGAIPEAAPEITGVYLVCIKAGSSVSLPDITGKSITEGDWILAVDDAWEFVNVGVSGGGGGGGASVLNDLLDVQIDTVRSLGQAGATAMAGYSLVDGDVLTYESGSGLWKNSSVIDCGTF